MLLLRLLVLMLLLRLRLLMLRLRLRLLLLRWRLLGLAAVSAIRRWRRSSLVRVLLRHGYHAVDNRSSTSRCEQGTARSTARVSLAAA
jgi:hypothetical protein